MAVRPDVTALPDLVHGGSRAGPVRERRPVYVDLPPPCNADCPAGENIQAWPAHTQASHHEQAWRELVADNPFACDSRAGLLPPVRERPQPRQRYFPAEAEEEPGPRRHLSLTCRLLDGSGLSVVSSGQTVVLDAGRPVSVTAAAPAQARIGN
jgi:hypothetical protein